MLIQMFRHRAKAQASTYGSVFRPIDQSRAFQMETIR
jgi:hypothetical protein